MGRRLCIFGFCRSVEMLSDVVEDTVLEHGGEVGVFSNLGRHQISLFLSSKLFLDSSLLLVLCVLKVVATETESKGGLQEKLTMTVAVPYLWGVPPAAERLHLAVRSGGGIVDKVSWQWDFL